jgi:addiction module RelE/StbE family toxin
MRVRYSPKALAQLEEIFNYIESESPAAAAAFSERLQRLSRLIAQFPLMGRPTDKPGARIVSIPEYRYVVFYRIQTDQNEIRILRIRHTSRRPATSYR